MAKFKTINIHGSDYVMVKERLIFFRENYPNFRLISEVIQLDEKHCVIKAVVLNDQNIAIATGIACEVNGSSNINKGSYVENCETSAWGRALGNMGIGIETDIASAEEMANRIVKPELSERDKKAKEAAKTIVEDEEPLPPPNDEAAEIIDEVKKKLSILAASHKWEVDYDKIDRAIYNMHKKWPANKESIEKIAVILTIKLKELCKETN